MSWRRARGARRPLLTCSECDAAIVNESNALKRAAWEESTEAPRRYRCGACAERAEMLQMIASEEPPAEH